MYKCNRLIKFKNNKNKVNYNNKEILMIILIKLIMIAIINNNMTLHSKINKILN